MPQAPLPDEPGVPAGTPAASLRKRPSWGTLDNVRRGDEKIMEYAPQLERPEEAFTAGSPLPGDDLDHALLVCRTQTFAKADAFAGDDLQVRVAFGHTPLVSNDGPEDANLGYVSAPLATLKKSDTVRFEVFDRDVWELETITKPTTTWNGGALTVLDPGATIECRSVAGEALQKLVSMHSMVADQAVNGLSATKLDPTSPTWGHPTLDIAMSRRHVGDVAALVGWDDPRAMRRVSAVDAAVVAVQNQRPGVFDGLYGSAAGSVTVGKVTVSNVRSECGPSGGDCTIHATLKNDAEKPLSFGSYDGLALYTATRESGPRAASYGHPEQTELAAGQTMELDITPDRGLRHGTTPSILGVCIASHCQPVKLK